MVRPSMSFIYSYTFYTYLVRPTTAIRQFHRYWNQPALHHARVFSLLRSSATASEISKRILKLRFLKLRFLDPKPHKTIQTGDRTKKNEKFAIVIIGVLDVLLFCSGSIFFALYIRIIITHNTKEVWFAFAKFQVRSE
jgi:hypothetical protein